MLLVIFLVELLLSDYSVSDDVSGFVDDEGFDHGADSHAG